MARTKGKSPSRLELRRAAEAAEKKPKVAAAKAEKPAKKAVKKKTTKKKSAKSAVSERLRMVWGVFDNSNQQVAAFPFSKRADAEKKVEELASKPRGPYFIQPVKEPILESEEEAAEEK